MAKAVNGVDLIGQNGEKASEMKAIASERQHG